MAKLTRPAQTKVFGSSALSAELTPFGSSTPSTDINAILNGTEAERGWGIVGANGFPPMEWFNALGYAQSYYTAYLFQQGIPSWTALQNYYVNSYAIGSNGKLYKSKTGTDGAPNVGNDPISDATNWGVFDFSDATHAATSKATPVDADELPILDSAATFGLKKLTWANLKATLVTYLSTTTGFAISLTNNGYIKLPSWLGGLIIQWGTYFIGDVINSNGIPITLPITYPNGNLFAIAGQQETSAGAWNAFVIGKSTTQVIIAPQEWSAVAQSASINWLSIGY